MPPPRGQPSSDASGDKAEEKKPKSKSKSPSPKRKAEARSKSPSKGDRSDTKSTLSSGKSAAKASSDPPESSGPPESDAKSTVSSTTNVATTNPTERNEPQDTQESAAEPSKGATPEAVVDDSQQAEVGKEKQPAGEKAASSPSTSSKKATSSTATRSRTGNTSTARSSGRAKEKEEKKEEKPPKSKQALAEEKQCLANVWKLFSFSKGDSTAKSAQRLSKAGSVSKDEITQLMKGSGASIDKEALEDFVKNELGADKGGVSEALFMEKSNAFFETCVPSEDCTEVWKLVGGSLSTAGVVQAPELGDALAKVGCKLSRAEVEDLVAYFSAGADRIAYDDFIQALFP